VARRRVIAPYNAEANAGGANINIGARLANVRELVIMRTNKPAVAFRSSFYLLVTLFVLAWSVPNSGAATETSGGCYDEPRELEEECSISGVVVPLPANLAIDIAIRATNSQGVSRIGITDKKGKFKIKHLLPGRYEVAPMQPGYVFSPNAVSVTITSANIKGLVFTQGTPAEGLSPSLLKQLDTEPDVATSPDTTILPNGQSLCAYSTAQGIPIPPGLQCSTAAAASQGVPAQTSQQLVVAAQTSPQLNRAIDAMLLAAQAYACGRQPSPCTTWNFPANPVNRITMPAQTGLTYVYGGRTPTVRTKPMDGCPQLTFGMDCSGFIYNVAMAAGISAPLGDNTVPPSVAQSQPANYIVPSGLSLQLVTDGSIQAGDILAWPGSRHVGIANSPAEVISSTGTSNDCIPNINPPKGPRTLTIGGLRLGQPTATLRLVSGIPPGTYTSTFTMAGPAGVGCVYTYTLTVNLTIVVPTTGDPTGSLTATGPVTYLSGSGPNGTGCPPSDVWTNPPASGVLSESGSDLSGFLLTSDTFWQFTLVNAAANAAATGDQIVGGMKLTHNPLGPNPNFPIDVTGQFVAVKQ
jgi:hypothetical protein